MKHVHYWPWRCALVALVLVIFCALVAGVSLALQAITLRAGLLLDPALALGLSFVLCVAAVGYWLREEIVLAVKEELEMRRAQRTSRRREK